MLLGSDLSHHNYGKIDASEFSFVILKATEGATYEDDKMENYLHDIGNKYQEGMISELPMFGFYHYARPENNQPETEAEHYIRTIKPHIGQCLMALDWEGNALKYPVSWALRWLNYVTEKTGIKPLLYCSASETKKFNIVFDRGYKLWVAHYNVVAPKVYGTQPTIWQFTSKPFDIDIFYGSKQDFIKLCIK